MPRSQRLATSDTDPEEQEQAGTGDDGTELLSTAEPRPRTCTAGRHLTVRLATLAAVGLLAFAGAASVAEWQPSDRSAARSAVHAEVVLASNDFFDEDAAEGDKAWGPAWSGGSDAISGGESCSYEEELWGKLCYKQCRLLTEGDEAGVHPIRTSPFSCCKDKPCGMSNTRWKLRICSGYNVGGELGCPHAPGACLDNEELHLGMCYKRCSDLTQDAFPHRVAAASCCKVKGLACLNFAVNVKTDSSFNTGGGADDFAKAHPPASAESS